MEGKVNLFDSDNVKIGETFLRRAKQLVKQQRASWLDDEQKAIKFAPGMEYMSSDSDVRSFETAAASHESDINEDWIVALAKKRLLKRKLFIIHTITFVPCLLIMALFFAAISNGFRSSEAIFFAGFSIGAWTTFYFNHVYDCIKNQYFNFNNKRKAKKLAAEVEFIKNELSA